MSENMAKLREAVNRRLRVRTGLTTAVEFDEASLGLQAALAAVEQEMAALRLSYENASRAHFEATKRIDALTEYHAALEAERDELRKRPTLDEVEVAIQELYNRDWNGPIVRPYTDVVRVIRAVYARPGLIALRAPTAPEKAAK